MGWVGGLKVKALITKYMDVPLDRKRRLPCRPQMLRWACLQNLYTLVSTYFERTPHSVEANSMIRTPS